MMILIFQFAILLDIPMKYPSEIRPQRIPVLIPMAGQSIALHRLADWSLSADLRGLRGPG